MVVRLYQYQVLAEPILPPAAPEAPSLTSWFVQASEPYPRRPASVLPADMQVAREGDAPAPPVEPPDLSDWFGPASEPVRTKAHALQPGYFVDPTVLTEATQIEPVPDLATFFQPASEPVRPVVHAQRPAFFVDPTLLTEATQTPPAASDIAWFVETSQPRQRRPKRIVLPAGHRVSLVKPTETFGWRAQQGQLVRKTPRLSEYPAYAVDPTLLTEASQVVPVPDFSWFAPASEPVRVGK